MNSQSQDSRFLENRKQNFGLHHTFDADLAVELKSIDLAVLVHHFQFWIRFNASTEVNLYDERTWTFQTLKDISAHFPYWTPRQVEKLIIKLVAADILIKGNYNKSPYDRTVWYAFKDEERFSIRRNRQMPDDTPISPNGEIENTEKGNQFPQTVTPIPDTLKKKKKKSAPLIEFDYETNQFVNIQDSDRADWTSLYAGVNLDLELGKMRQWLMDPKNPERDGNRTFITNWLSRAQKEVAKTPRKPTPSNPEPTVLPNANGSIIPYNSSIAYSILHDRGMDAYVDYLKRLSDQKYYNNHLNGKYEQNYIDYLQEQQGE